MMTSLGAWVEYEKRIDNQVSKTALALAVPALAAIVFEVFLTKGNRGQTTVSRRLLQRLPCRCGAVS